MATDDIAILRRQSERLIKQVTTTYVRNVYYSISWNSRLIGIKGARGVGKTTLMLQRIALNFPDISKVLYVTLDNIWFAGHNLVELAEMAVDQGITHLFLDEIHKLRGWERQIKNIYDMFPQLNVVFTGSSLLEIDNSIADLSRRCLMYTIPGLSFREYLIFEGIERPIVKLSDILYAQDEIVPSIVKDVDILKKFQKYLRHGFYPFYRSESEADYLSRVNNIILSVIDNDIPAVENVEYATLLKIKHLLTVIAAQTPSPLNATALARLMGTTQNQVIKLLSLLDRAQILRLLYYKAERNPKSMAKPQKVLINNASLIFGLGYADVGKVRESFFASMLAEGNELTYPKQGDLLVNGRYLFEIGGPNKGYDQIKDMPDSFIAVDGIEFGLGNKIPLWLFGFLY